MDRNSHKFGKDPQMLK